VRLLQIFAQGLGKDPTATTDDCLKRMGLREPKSLIDWTKATLVRGALRQTPLADKDIAASAG
jgi:hypothetical protein